MKLYIELQGQLYSITEAALGQLDLDTKLA